MTQQEYIKLVQGSAAFQGMDTETQNKILTAHGADMEEYIRLFTQEKKMMIDALAKNQQTNDEIIKAFKDKAQKKHMTKLKNEEDEEKKEAAGEADDLLKQL